MTESVTERKKEMDREAMRKFPRKYKERKIRERDAMIEKDYQGLTCRQSLHEVPSKTRSRTTPIRE